MAATETLMLAKGAIQMMFIAKIKTVSLAAAACLVVAGSGVVAAKQFTATVTPPPATVVLTSHASPSAQTVTLPPVLQEPARSTENRPEPASPVVLAQTEPSAAPAASSEYKPIQLTCGVIVGMRNNAGRWSCRVALQKPFNNLTEIDVYCCNPPAIILLDGKPATFEQAVAPKRHIEFDHVRGATPYISVSSEATKRSPLTWAEIMQKADAAAPGMFADRKPTGATRDIQVSLDEDGLYTVSTINSNIVAGTKQETGRCVVKVSAVPMPIAN